MTTGAPSALESAGCADRVIVSTPEAVATGRMNLIGLSLWACNRVESVAAVTHKSTARHRPRLFFALDNGRYESLLRTMVPLRSFMRSHALCTVDRFQRRRSRCRRAARACARPFSADEVERRAAVPPS